MSRHFTVSLAILSIVLGLTQAPFYFTVTAASQRYTSTVSNFTFAPSTLTIAPGDTVQWVFHDGTHSTTSVDGLWDSGVQSSGTFAFTFPTSGSYAFFCKLHSSMTGIITVQESVPHSAYIPLLVRALPLIPPATPPLESPSPSPQTLDTPTLTPTDTPTWTSTTTPTSVSSSTATSTMSATAIHTTKPSNTPTSTATPINTATSTATATRTATSTPTPAKTTGPTTTPTQLPVSFNSCADTPTNAPNYPVRITNVDKRGETVTIRNVSTSAVNLNGWRICSITGGQRHAILNGTLQPGQQVTIASQAGGPIWNNSASDPGALWTNDGRPVSYWSDPPN